MRLEKLDKLTRRKVLSLGLCQLEDEGLQRILDWDGPMLLDGSIYDEKTGHC